MFYKVFSFKHTLTAVAIVAIFALSVGLASKALSSAVVGRERQIPIYSVKTDEKKIAVTFDAAWGDSDTQILIDILTQYDAKATFFVVGEWAKRCPQSVKALFDAGHQIANHSDTHALFSSLSATGVQREINGCNERLVGITGEKPAYVRFPSGDYDNESIAAAENIGMTVIQWSVDSLDYKGGSSDEIAARVLKKVQPGAIVLFHNDIKNTPEALKTVLMGLKELGYSFVTVDELVYKGNYTIDNTGQQISKAQPTISE